MASCLQCEQTSPLLHSRHTRYPQGTSSFSTPAQKSQAHTWPTTTKSYQISMILRQTTGWILVERTENLHMNLRETPYLASSSGCGNLGCVGWEWYSHNDVQSRHATVLCFDFHVDLIRGHIQVCMKSDTNIGSPLDGSFQVPLQ